MYKQIIFTLIVIFTMIFFSCSEKKGEIGNNTDTKYIAYYFHPTGRCKECINMENYTKELIETKYADKGFKFETVNIDSNENQHFRKDYALQFSSVILVNTKNNSWKNLDSVWSYTDNKDKFFKYSETEINNFINTK
jgi:hypothetical protein